MVQAPLIRQARSGAGYQMHTLATNYYKSKDYLKAHSLYLRLGRVYLEVLAKRADLGGERKMLLRPLVEDALSRVEEIEARFQKEFEEEEARAAHEAASRAAAAKKVVKPSTAAPPPSLKPAFGVLPQYPTAPSPSQASPVRAPSYPDLSSLPPMSPHMPSPSDAFHHPSSAPALHHHQHPAGPHDHDHSSSAFDAPPTLPPKPAHISSMDDLYFAGNDLPVLPPKPTELRFSSPLDHSLAPTIPPKPAGMRRESTDGVCDFRDIVVPSHLLSTFLELAYPSTLRNIETCGILCGKLLDGVLVVSHLLLPQQTGTSDSCSTTHEEEIMVFQEEHGVDAFGWIHTHPSQRCFMSSVDLHTHCFYQLMLPEAIAIVCAPKSDPDWGVFRLTDPVGVDHISSCSERGFHPHTLSDDSLYVEVSGGGTVILRDAPLTTTDLRVGN